MTDFTYPPAFDRFNPRKETRRMPTEGSFPRQLHMPYNYYGQTTVESVIGPALEKEKHPLIVTGYTSLLKLIELLASLKEEQDLRFLLGNDPTPIFSKNMRLQPVSFPEEVRQYWLQRRVSLLQYPNLLAAHDRIRNGQLDAVFLDIPGRMMHAKIVVTEHAAMVGSSNFSKAGLTKNIEANVWFRQDEEEPRYSEVKDYAEALFSLGEDYKGHLIALLDALIRESDWQDCIARACSELLEGHWAEKYCAYRSIESDATLWPSQKQGIAQALWIIENLGSVLIADATGSGKTRLGAALLRAVNDKLWRSGNARGGGLTLISPPGVTQNWQSESLNYGFSPNMLSQGALSFVKRARMEDLVNRAIKLAQVLAVDEAHNYLNTSAKRAQVLLRNLADHVLLFTATPLNKSPSDLLCLVNILGADNFDPAVIRDFNRWLRLDVGKMRQARESQLKGLKQEIGKFTLRRTKRDFNALVYAAPECYRDKHGKQCRYPEHNAKPYATGESEPAVQAALRIRTLADKLQGIAFISQPIRLPEAADTVGSDELANRTLNGRLAMAKRSAIYQIMSHLRSSRAAAISHIAGSTEMANIFGLSGQNLPEQKGIIPQLDKNAGKPPGVELDDLSIEGPLWLTDSVAHRQVCGREQVVYCQILEELVALDDSRELAKLRLLDRLLTNQSRIGIIAFDRHPVTLHYLRKLAGEHNLLENSQLIVATGSSSKKALREADRYLNNKYRLTESVVLLGSDALAESYNFQNASRLVHLDMPSVVRLVEQRVGRIDRMDSTHPSIDVYWPKDHRAFALRSDDRLLERYEANSLLLGSNLPLPDEMLEGLSHEVSYEAIIKEAETTDIRWDGIEDAFDPVRRLIGPKALVRSDHYEQMAKNQETSARIAAVSSTEPWAFFCVSGSELGAPKWILFNSDSSAPITDLSTISNWLQDKLGDYPGNSPEKRDIRDPACVERLEDYLSKLHPLERELLPRRKQAALREMEAILKKYHSTIEEPAEQAFLGELIKVLDPNTVCQQAVDWATLADRWLELVRPYWYRKLGEKRGRRAVLLSDIHDELIEEPISFSELEQQFATIPSTRPIADRIAACILAY